MRTLFSFLSVGVINTVAGYGLMFFALAFGASYWYATWAGTTLGLIVSFLLNRKYTFRHSGQPWKVFLRFAAASYVCYIAAFGLSKGISHGWTWPNGALTPEQVAAIIGGVLYTMCHYIALRWFVFRSKH
jgi:putative flippase GtrA